MAAQDEQRERSRSGDTRVSPKSSSDDPPDDGIATDPSDSSLSAVAAAAPRADAGSEDRNGLVVGGASSSSPPPPPPPSPPTEIFDRMDGSSVQSVPPNAAAHVITSQDLFRYKATSAGPSSASAVGSEDGAASEMQDLDVDQDLDPDLDLDLDTEEEAPPLTGQGSQQRRPRRGLNRTISTMAVANSVRVPKKSGDGALRLRRKGPATPNQVAETVDLESGGGCRGGDGGDGGKGDGECAVAFTDSTRAFNGVHNFDCGPGSVATLESTVRSSASSGVQKLWDRMTRPKGDVFDAFDDDYDNDKDHREPISRREACRYLCINAWYRIKVSSRMNLQVLRAHPYIPAATLVFFVLLCVASVGTTLVLSNRYGEETRKTAYHYGVMGRQLLTDQMDTTLESLHALLHGTHEDPLLDLPFRIGVAGEPGSAPFLPAAAVEEERHDHHEDGHEGEDHEDHHRRAESSSYVRNVTGICDDPSLVDEFGRTAEVVRHAAMLHGVVIHRTTLAPYGVVCLSSPSLEGSGYVRGLDLFADPEHRHTSEEAVSSPGALFSGPYRVERDDADADGEVGDGHSVHGAEAHHGDDHDGHVVMSDDHHSGHGVGVDDHKEHEGHVMGGNDHGDHTGGFGEDVHDAALDESHGDDGAQNGAMYESEGHGHDVHGALHDSEGDSDKGELQVDEEVTVETHGDEEQEDEEHGKYAHIAEADAAGENTGYARHDKGERRTQDEAHDDEGHGGIFLHEGGSHAHETHGLEVHADEAHDDGANADGHHDGDGNSDVIGHEEEIDAEENHEGEHENGGHEDETHEDGARKGENHEHSPAGSVHGTESHGASSHGHDTHAGGAHDEHGADFHGSHAHGEGEKFYSIWVIHIPIQMPPELGYAFNNHWGIMEVSVDWDEFLRESGIAPFFDQHDGLQFVITRGSDGAAAGSSHVHLAKSDGADAVHPSHFTHMELDYRDTNEQWTLGVGVTDGYRPPWFGLGIGISVLLSFLVSCMFLFILIAWQGHKDLLLEMLPRKALQARQRGEIYVDKFDIVTIFFSDIVGYTSMSSEMRPVDIMKMLNSFYTEVDKLADKHKVYKVETIGDAYMCVGGCPDRCIGPLGAQRVALFALDMIKLVKDFRLDDGSQIFVRCGIHSGRVVAGVVGNKLPHFSLFGDAVNTASRMESTSEKMRIQCSDMTYRLLRDSPGCRFDLSERGGVEVKGKGRMHTWWINGVLQETAGSEGMFKIGVNADSNVPM